MNSGIIIDTGPIVAILSSRDRYHQNCLDVLADIRSQLYSTWPIVTEAHYLLRKDKRACTGLFTLLRENVIKLVDLDKESITWIERYLEKYSNIHLQLADVSLAYIADQFNLRTVFTLDRRDFSLIKLSGNKSLKIIPG